MEISLKVPLLVVMILAILFVAVFLQYDIGRKMVAIGAMLESGAQGIYKTASRINKTLDHFLDEFSYSNRNE